MSVRFRDGQRLLITNHGSRPELNGMTATVVRRLMSTSHEAWVRTDSDLPAHCRRFPAGDQRENHICVYNDEVEEIPAESPIRRSQALTGD